MLTTFLFGETLQLHPDRAIYWPRRKTLLISDLHIGKATHFRKNGIPAPAALADTNRERLSALLLDLQPEQVCFLGDLSHSTFNTEWTDFCELTHQFSNVTFRLIPGNHDQLKSEQYAEARLYIEATQLKMDNFLLTHCPLPKPPTDAYNLAGHIHPCVKLRGAGRQRMRLPCFWFGEQQGILPAFGAFTGMAEVQPRMADQVFVILDNQVIAIQNEAL